MGFIFSRKRISLFRLRKSISSVFILAFLLSHVALFSPVSFAEETPAEPVVETPAEVLPEILPSVEVVPSDAPTNIFDDIVLNEEVVVDVPARVEDLGEAENIPVPVVEEIATPTLAEPESTANTTPVFPELAASSTEIVFETNTTNSDTSSAILTDETIESVATSTESVVEPRLLPVLNYENSIVDLSLPENISEDILINSVKNIEALPLRISFAQTTSTSTPMLRNDFVVYENVFFNTDVEYKITERGLKENIILKTSEHPAEFSYNINLENYDHVISGNILRLYKKGHAGNALHLQYTISAPYMSDAAGNKSTDIALDVIDGKLVITPSSTWLSAAVYPVVVDPTVEISVLNTHSNPVAGQDWVVDFTTVGTGDLTITPADQATIDDDQFVSLYCGAEDRTAQVQILPGDVLFYPNWNCEEVAQLTHLTLVTGNHHLLLAFGGEEETVTSEAFNANRTWDGGGGDALWSNDLNWSSDTEPGVSDVAVFDGTCVSNCSPTIDTAISVLGISMNAGYGGVITQSNTVTLGSSGFVIAAGTFTGNSSTITINGSFSQTGGVFTSTSGTMNIRTNFTYTAGTFTHNSGTVHIFDDDWAQSTTFSCGGVTFNKVTITKDQGAWGSFPSHVTFASDCTIPLGASPTITVTAGTFINNGTITIASGTWTYNGSSSANTFTNNGTITHNGDGLVIKPSFTMGVGSTFTYSGSSASFYQSLNLTNGTFPSGLTLSLLDDEWQQSATVSCGSVNFTQVIITKDQGAWGSFPSHVTFASGCVIPLGNSPTTVVSAGTFTNNGTITIASGTWTYGSGGSSSNVFTNNGTIIHDGNGLIIGPSFIMGAGSVFTYAGSTATFYRDLNVSQGTFPSGLTVSFLDNDWQQSSTLTCGSVTFTKIILTKDQGSSSPFESNFVISSGCVVPLGASPTTYINGSVGAITNNGTITVDSGTWTHNGFNNLQNNGTITHNGNGWVSQGGLVNGASGVVTYAGSTASFNRDLNVSQGTFPSGLTVSFLDNDWQQSSTLTCGSVTFTKIILTKDQGSSGGFLSNFTVAPGCIVPLGASPTTYLNGSGVITNNGTTTVASGTWTHTGYNNFINNGDVVHSGSGWVSEGGLVMNLSTSTVTYAGTAITLGKDLNVLLGTFPAGKSITFNGANAGVYTASSTLSIADLTLNKTSSQTLSLAGIASTTVTGNLTFTNGIFSNPAATTTLTVQGNYSQASTLAFGGSNLVLSLEGTATSTLSRTAGNIQSSIIINKTGAGGAALGSTFFASSTLALQAGLFDASSYANTITGLVTVSGGNYIASSSTQTLNSGLTVSGGIFTGGSGTTDINGALTLSLGTVNPAGIMTISGNLVHTSGIFSASSGTVTFDGTNQSISGNNTFYNLTKSVTSAATLTFDAGTTNTITNTLTLSGAVSNLLSLRSSSNGSQWNINPQGTRTLSYLDVKDSNNTNSLFINATSINSTDSGNNTNWLFTAPTLTQGSYQFYQNIDQLQPVTSLSSQNATSTIFATTSPIRLRVNVAPTVGTAPANYLQVKLQVSTTTNGTWTDVGTGGSDWFNQSWQNRKKITLNNSASSENLVDFPIVVNLTSSNINYSRTKDDGSDIRFVDSDGTTELNYEIEKWNELATSTAWVKVPQIDANSSADYIWMYYNNPSATSNATTTGVWDTSFKLVQHLSETSGTVTSDSTLNANNGSKVTSVNPLATTTAQIGGAQTFNGSTSYLNVTSNSTLNPSAITLDTWVKIPTGYNTYGNIISKGFNSQYRYRINDNRTVSILDRGGTNVLTTAVTIPVETWTHIVATGNASGLKIYINGVERATNATAFGGASTASNLSIGRGDDGSEYFNGIIDEVRISNTARSVSWILAEYNSASGLMNTFNTEETIPSPEWFFYNNPSLTSSTTITATLLSISDVTGTYQEGNPTSLNSLALANGEYIEYDWAIDPTGVSANSNYLFRMVKSDGTLFDTYTNYATLTYTANNAPTVSTLAPATYVDGSWGSDNTPTLTFTTADADVADTVQYQIQIATTSDFSTTLVDYTSVLATPGAKSFTVGQVLGGGLYTVGSVGQTLLDANNYYWRVRAIDSVGQTSSYSTANSGSIAFKVDTVLTSPGTVALSNVSSSGITVTLSSASDSGVGLSATPYIFYNTIASTNSTATTSTTWIETGLSPNTSYTYEVNVVDILGNTATTSTASTYTLATVPTSVSATVDSATQITLSWDANSNASGTEYYAVNTTASTTSSWITATSTAFGGLSCATEYSFEVKARNGDGVETATTTAVLATTSACPVVVSGNGNGGSNGSPGNGGGGGVGSSPRSPSQGFSVRINDGASTTSVSQVTLKLDGGPDATRVLISNTSDFIGAQLQDYTKSVPWNLCGGVCANGTYGVYVKFYTFWGAASPMVYDTIELNYQGDTYTPPPVDKKALLNIGLGASLDRKVWFSPLVGIVTGSKVSLKVDTSLQSVGKDKIKYEFDCTSDGIADYSILNSSQTSATATNLCTYTTAGIYTAKVNVIRGGLTTSKTVLVSAGNPVAPPVVPPPVLPPATTTPPIIIEPVATTTPSSLPPATTTPPSVIPEITLPPLVTSTESTPIISQIIESTAGAVAVTLETISNIGSSVASGVELLADTVTFVGAVTNNVFTQTFDTAVQASSYVSHGIADTFAQSQDIVKDIVERTKSNQTMLRIGAVSLAPVVLAAQRSISSSDLLAHIKSLSDVAYAATSLFNGLLTALGIRKRRRRWGTVYDAVTKQPLDPVLVELVDARTGTVVEESITDMLGRFGFLDRLGRFSIRVHKTNYSFPSHVVLGSKDMLFENVYHGEVFNVLSAGDVIAPNIPMDQVAVDWNQVEKKRLGYGNTSVHLDTIIAKGLQVIFWTGFAVTGFMFLSDPGILNGVLIGLYALLSVLNLYLPKPHLWGKIVSSHVSPGGLLIELRHESIPDVVVGKAITNESGKFTLKAMPGQRYILKVKSIGETTNILLTEQVVTVGGDGVVNDVIALD